MNKDFCLANEINAETYKDYLDRLKLLATSLFTWKGLDEIAGYGASKFLEQVLFENGKACFVKDKELGFIVLRVMGDDIRNIYNIPTKVIAHSNNYQKEFKFEEINLILNNNLELPTYQTIKQYSYRLFDVTRTMDLNLTAQKTPILLQGETKDILTLKNVYNQYTGNSPVLFGNKSFDITNKLNVLNTTAPYLLDKLNTYKIDLWNECLTYLGINNSNTQKKERLITDEVNSNNDLINYYLNCFYKTRKKACDEINVRYNLNIQIELNRDLSDLLDNGIDDNSLDGDNNE